MIHPFLLCILTSMEERLTITFLSPLVCCYLSQFPVFWFMIFFFMCSLVLYILPSHGFSGLLKRFPIVKFEEICQVIICPVCYLFSCFIYRFPQHVSYLSNKAFLLACCSLENVMFHMNKKISVFLYYISSATCILYHSLFQVLIFHV